MSTSTGTSLINYHNNVYKHEHLSALSRLIGLDPASPGFEFNPVDLDPLNKDDAEFVDVIHTTGWKIGFTKRIGHVDFFPNGGIAPQPGCFSLFHFLQTCELVLKINYNNHLVNL